MCKKMYNSAPLPFMGQKRRFVKDFKDVLKSTSGITTIVDLFGGSGLLSHVAKSVLPHIRVVYNDYDGYSERINNITTTNKIIAEIRQLLKPVPIDKKVPEEIRSQILRLLESYNVAGYVDYLTIGSSILFSGKWVKSLAELSKQTMYNCCRTTEYKADGYLDGLEIVCKDYKELFKEFKDNKEVLFLVDPPYLSTEVGAYKCYWKLSDYLDVLNVIEKSKYIYFTSNKSQVIELCQWIAKNPDFGDPFNGAEIHTQTSNINYQSGYVDIMLVKK
ncbi:MAG: DNA adenine methylase [Muribaculaceae bacterium]|nr:DNA adenine methylase [Muribaculaceae bacterium]